MIDDLLLVIFVYLLNHFLFVINFINMSIVIIIVIHLSNKHYLL